MLSCVLSQNSNEAMKNYRVVEIYRVNFSPDLTSVISTCYVIDYYYHGAYYVIMVGRHFHWVTVRIRLRVRLRIRFSFRVINLTEYLIFDSDKFRRTMQL